MSKNQEIEMAIDLAAFTVIVRNLVEKDKVERLHNKMYEKSWKNVITTEIVFNYLYDKYCWEEHHAQ